MATKITKIAVLDYEKVLNSIGSSLPITTETMNVDVDRIQGEVNTINTSYDAVVKAWGALDTTVKNEVSANTCKYDQTRKKRLSNYEQSIKKQHDRTANRQKALTDLYKADIAEKNKAEQAAKTQAAIDNVANDPDIPETSRAKIVEAMKLIAEK